MLRLATQKAQNSVFVSSFRDCFCELDGGSSNVHHSQITSYDHRA